MVPNSFKDQINEQNKDINLIDLFIFLLKYKWLILSCIIVAGISVPLYLTISERLKAETITAPDGTLQEKYYYSECSISSTDSSRVIIFLKSRDLTMKVVKDNHLPRIRFNVWNETKSKWVTERLYDWDDKDNVLIEGKPDSKNVSDSMATLYTRRQENVITIAFSSNEKDKTIKILDEYLSYISDSYRKREMEILKARRNMYEGQMKFASNTYYKTQLAFGLIEVTNRELRAKNDPYYGYEMFDSPYTIEVKPQPQKQIVKAPSTKRNILITLLMMMAAFVIALSLAGAMEYLTLVKKSDPEKFNVLLKQLRFKSRSGKTVNPD